MLRRNYLGLFALVLWVSIAAAQDACTTLDPALVADLRETCELETGSACLVDGTTQALEGITLTAPATFALAGNDEAALTAWLLGSATVSDITVVEAQTRIPARNSAGYNVNLRGGPGTNFDQVGVLSFEEAAEADARSEDSTWVRLVTEQDGIVWVGAGLVALEGDLAALPIATGSEASTTQALTLNGEPCAEGVSGLLLIYEGLTPASVTVNETPLQVTGAVALLELTDEDLRLAVIEGEAQVGTGAERTALEQGQALPLNADGEVEALDLAVLTQLPLTDLLDIPVACVVETVAETAVRELPEVDAAVVSTLPATSYALAEGQSVASEWWLLSEGWIADADVTRYGDCADLELIENPTVPTDEPIASVPQSDPASTMYSYLQARVDANVSVMQTLSCAAWDNQAFIQAQSFRSMNASLEGVACSTVSNEGSRATVFCGGNIVTLYNGQTRLWDLGNYSMVVEGGEWRMCGES